MIDNKELRTKHSKRGRPLYFYVEEKQNRTATRQKTWSHSGRKELTAEEYERGKANFEDTKAPGLHAQTIMFNSIKSVTC